MTEYAAARASSVGSTRMLRYRSRPVPAGISLPMMTFSFRPTQRVGLAVDRRVGEHAGGLLEGGRRQPRLGRERGLGDAHQLRTTRGRLAALGDHAPVLLLEARPGRRGRDGQQVGVAGLDDRDPAQHLPHDDLDVLVVDRHTLRAVDLLDLVHEVLLRLADAEDPQDLLRVGRADDQLLADLDVVAVGDQQAANAWLTGYSCTSEPSSGVTRTLRALSVSSISIRPAASAIGDTPLG